MLGAEQFGLAYACRAPQRIQHVDRQVVAQRGLVGLAVGGDSGDEHEVGIAGFQHLHAGLLHHLRQSWQRQLQLVLHLHLGDLGIGARLEIQVDADRSARLAGGRHVQQAVQAVQLLLDDGSDRIGHGLCGCTGVIGAHRNGRRRDHRILRDRQLAQCHAAGQHNEDSDHPGENRAIDEKSCHAGLPLG